MRRPEGPPFSEGEHNEKIRIEVSQPELISQLAINQLKSDNPLHSSVVGYSKLENSKLFSELYCEVSFRDNKIEFEEIYAFMTINKSKLEKGKNEGFLNKQRIKNIARLLKEDGGYKVTHNQLKNGENYLHIEKGQLTSQVFLGFPNIKVEEKSIKAKIVEVERDIAKTTLTEKVEGLKVERRELHNEIQKLHQTSTTQQKWLLFRGIINPLPYGVKDYTSEYLKKYTIPDTVESIKAQAQVIEDVLQALHWESEVKSPNVVFKLRPPVRNKDSVAEVFSEEEVEPLLLKPEDIEREKVYFSDIAGQNKAVEEAKKLVAEINNPEIFKKRGVNPTKGILLYGEPGTGKTMMAKAIATESGLQDSFFNISFASILDKYYGESPKILNRIFDKAKKAALEYGKAIIFFDEIDAIASARTSDGSGGGSADNKLVATLLTNMDGFSKDPSVIVLAATNRVDALDPAIKRPGRFDKLIEVGLPNKEGRKAILETHISKLKLRAEIPIESFADDIELDEIAGKTNGLSGADLAHLINSASENMLWNEINGGEWSPVSQNDLLNVLASVYEEKETKKKFGFI